MEQPLETPIREEDNPEIVNRRLSNFFGYHYAMALGGVRKYVGPYGDWHDGVPNFQINIVLCQGALAVIAAGNQALVPVFVNHLIEVLKERDFWPILEKGEENIFPMQIASCMLAGADAYSRALFRTVKAENNRGLDFDDNEQFTR